MQKTQQFLNQILQRRLGSVVNRISNFNTHTGATRLPKKEQTLANMPTVFRKRHQQFLETQAQQSIGFDEEEPASNGQQQQSTHVQKVEYALISKRMVNKEQQQIGEAFGSQRGIIDAHSKSKTPEMVTSTRRIRIFKDNL